MTAAWDQAVQRMLDQQITLYLTRHARRGYVVYAEGQRWAVAHLEDRAEVLDLLRARGLRVRVHSPEATTTNTVYPSPEVLVVVERIGRAVLKIARLFY